MRTGRIVRVLGGVSDQRPGVDRHDLLGKGRMWDVHQQVWSRNSNIMHEKEEEGSGVRTGSVSMHQQVSVTNPIPKSSITPTCLAKGSTTLTLEGSWPFGWYTRRLEAFHAAQKQHGSLVSKCGMDTRVQTLFAMCHQAE